MAGKFVVTKGKDGQYRFALKAGNGETIATSEGYKNKASALDGIASVKSNAGSAPTDDQTGE
ncbi:MAG TPA: YegP family protein [Candidatus Limnocylindrales bacterium]|nr:YegP family protein [Candidatus Limnocylindrales bacterium]